jgi:hypothetical protein
MRVDNRRRRGRTIVSMIGRERNGDDFGGVYAPQSPEEARAITDTSEFAVTTQLARARRLSATFAAVVAERSGVRDRTPARPDERIHWDRSSEFSSRSSGAPRGAFGLARPFVSLRGRDMGRSSIRNKAGHRPPSSPVSTPGRHRRERRRQVTTDKHVRRHPDCVLGSLCRRGGQHPRPPLGLHRELVVDGPASSWRCYSDGRSSST